MRDRPRGLPQIEMRTDHFKQKIRPQGMFFIISGDIGIMLVLR